MNYLYDKFYSRMEQVAKEQAKAEENWEEVTLTIRGWKDGEKGRWTITRYVGSHRELDREVHAFAKFNGISDYYVAGQIS